MLAGLLVPHSAIKVLKGKHPFQVPTHLGEIIWKLAAGFRDAEGESLQTARIKLPGPQQGTCSDGAINHVAAVVTGVVPSAVIECRSRPSGTGMECVYQMA